MCKLTPINDWYSVLLFTSANQYQCLWQSDCPLCASNISARTANHPQLTKRQPQSCYVYNDPRYLAVRLHRRRQQMQYRYCTSDCRMPCCGRALGYICAICAHRARMPSYSIYIYLSVDCLHMCIFIIYLLIAFHIVVLYILCKIFSFSSSLLHRRIAEVVPLIATGFMMLPLLFKTYFIMCV